MVASLVTAMEATVLIKELVAFTPMVDIPRGTKVNPPVGAKSMDTPTATTLDTKQVMVIQDMVLTQLDTIRADMDTIPATGTTGEDMGTRALTG